MHACVMSKSNAAAVAGLATIGVLTVGGIAVVANSATNQDLGTDDRGVSWSVSRSFLSPKLEPKWKEQGTESPT